MLLEGFPWFKSIDADAFVAGNPQAINQVLEACCGRGEAPLVTTLVLRSMKRAVYSAELDGHYALASDAYAHFTSPIRRYPDLVVHRMLKAALEGRPEKFDQEVSVAGSEDHRVDGEARRRVVLGNDCRCGIVRPVRAAR